MLMPMQSSDATYFLSGFLHGTEAKHVIKVVDSNCLEHEKLGFENLTSMHVYSVQPRSLATLENLYDTDMIDCRENNARGGLSRVVAAQSDAEAPRKVATSGSTAHHPIHKSPCAKKLPVVTKHSPPKEGKEVAKKSQGPSGQKRKQQVIDSDDDSIDDMGEKTTAEAPEQVPDEGGETSHPPVASEKRYKTFINDNGEEVTGMSGCVIVYTYVRPSVLVLGLVLLCSYVRGHGICTHSSMLEEHMLTTICRTCTDWEPHAWREW